MAEEGRPDWRVALGIVIGFVGVAMLITGQDIEGGFSNGGL